MPQQEDIVRELYSRMDSLAPDKQAIVQELGNRMGIARDASQQARDSSLGRAQEQLKPTDEQNEPGFFQRLYEGTVQPIKQGLATYGQHIQENTPKYGMAAGFPALAQTVGDLGKGMVQSSGEAVNRVGDALKKGDLATAGQQLPSVIPGGQVFTKAGEDQQAGNYAGMAGNIAAGATQMAGPELANPSTLTRTVGGAVKGAAKGATAMTPIGHFVHIPVPASVAGGIAGHWLGHHLGGAEGAEAGAAIGAAAPMVRGAVNGAKEAFSKSDIPSVDMDLSFAKSAITRNARAVPSPETPPPAPAMAAPAQDTSGIHAVGKSTPAPAMAAPGQAGLHHIPQDSSVLGHQAAENAKAYNIAHFIHSSDPTISPDVLDHMTPEQHMQLANEALAHGRNVGNVVPASKYKSGLEGNSLKLAKQHLADLQAGTPKNVPVKPAVPEQNIEDLLQQSIARVSGNR